MNKQQIYAEVARLHQTVATAIGNVRTKVKELPEELQEGVHAELTKAEDAIHYDLIQAKTNLETASTGFFVRLSRDFNLLWAHHASGNQGQVVQPLPGLRPSATAPAPAQPEVPVAAAPEGKSDTH